MIARKFFSFFFFADENTKGRRRGPQGKVKVWLIKLTKFYTLTYGKMACSTP